MAKNLGLPSDPALLGALLEGLQMSRQRLDAQIASVKAAIAGEPEPAPAAVEEEAPAAAPRKGKKGRKPGSGRRKLSPAARKAIAAAQKRRWEEFRKKNEK